MATTPMFEVAPREDTRSPVGGRPVRPWRTTLMLLPAAVLVGAVLVVPLLATVVRSFDVPGPGMGLAHYSDVLHDEQVRRAMVNSLRWLAIAPLVCGVGYLIATLGRGARRSRALLIGVIAAPMAVSSLVAGMTFRLMFDAQPERGTVTKLATAAQDWFRDDSPLAGARPAASSPLQVDDTSGDLVTASPVGPGGSVRLALTDGAAHGPTNRPGLPQAGSDELAGIVTLDGRPVPDVEVTASRVTDRTARTDGDGVFRFDVSGEPTAPDAEYQLRIAASAVEPADGTVSFLGPTGIWWVLGSAFAWAWMGFVVVVLRSGLGSVPRDLLRMARAYGLSRTRRFVTIVLPALIPVTAMVLLTLLVAAARIFDLVLVGAPGSVQDDADVVGLHWWRSHDVLGDGGAAALAVLLFVAVAAVALVALWGLNRQWPTARPSARTEPDRSRPPLRRWLIRVAGAVAMALWLVPFLVLLFTSLRSPRDSGVAGWWVGGADGWGLESYREAFRSGELADSLVATAVRSIVATSLLLIVAVPAAYALACGELTRRTRKVLVTVAALLAVVPVQAVADPLGSVFDALRLSGAPTALTLVHVAFGVPFAVLLLRPAFRAVRQRDALRLRSDEGALSALSTVVNRAWMTVLAVAVLEFVLVWNDLVVGLILGGPEKGPITLVLLGQARQFATSSGVMAAGAVVSLIVPLALVLVTGKWVVRGLAAGVAR